MRAIPIQGASLPKSGNLAFGAQRTPTHVHRGVDLPRPEGTPVYAAADGKVEHASSQWAQGFSGYGAHVVLRHERAAAWTLYAHLSTVDVNPGQVVLAGDRIGSVGRTEFTREDHNALLRGPHLHFEVSPRSYPQPSEAVRLDPAEWLRAAVDPRVAGAIASAARSTGVDLALLRALAWVASGWNPAATSSRPGARSNENALGLFGLLPDQLRLLGVAEPFSPAANALAGAKLLRSLLQRFESIATALAAYVWGTPNVDRAPLLTQWPAAVEQWVARVLDRYSVEQGEGAPPLVQRRARDGARS